MVRFDQRGHGLTGPAADADYSIEAFAGDIDAVVDALGVERFVLAGNSMGGAIAMQYAIASPERLDGLVLVDAAGPRSSAMPMAISPSSWLQCPAWAA